MYDEAWTVLEVELCSFFEIEARKLDFLGKKNARFCNIRQVFMNEMFVF